MPFFWAFFLHFTFRKTVNAKLDKAFQLVVSLPVPYSNIALHQELQLSAAMVRSSAVTCPVGYGLTSCVTYVVFVS